MAIFNDAFVLGVAFHPATRLEHSLRLEEMVYHTARRAVDHAGVSRRQLDNVVLGASDELDGRPISSMLMTAPAGGYLTDEIRVTDSGAMALCLGFARIRSGDFHLGMVSSWCKSSKTDPDEVERLRADPFFTRALNIGVAGGHGLFAQAVARNCDIAAAEADRRAHDAACRAASNPRGLRMPVESREAISASERLAGPVRQGHVAPPSDGAVSIVLASRQFLDANPDCRPLARIAGVGWAADSYRLDAERLGSLHSARRAWRMALDAAGWSSAAELDAVEIESPTSWHEAAYVRAFGITDEHTLSPSGTSFAQNPVFCTGLANAAEAILQVAGQAGPMQRPRVRRAAAHGCHGLAQQGNVVAMFEAVDAS